MISLEEMNQKMILHVRFQQHVPFQQHAPVYKYAPVYQHFPFQQHVPFQQYAPVYQHFPFQQHVPFQQYAPVYQHVPEPEPDFDYESESEPDPNPINNMEIFREPNCIICLEEKPNILFCNCGHIPLCEKCDAEYKKKKCPVCKTKSAIKRKL